MPVVQARDPAWFEYIAKGADAVYTANPDLLIAMGGTLSSTDASFLKRDDLATTLDRGRWPNKVDRQREVGSGAKMIITTSNA